MQCRTMHCTITISMLAMELQEQERALERAAAEALAAGAAAEAQHAEEAARLAAESERLHNVAAEVRSDGHST